MARSHRLLQTRNRQSTTGGLGIHFASPIKPRDKKKTSTIVHIPGHQHKRQALLDEIQALLRQSAPSPTPNDLKDPDACMLLDPIDDETANVPEAIEHDQDIPPESEDTVKRRILPNDEAYTLYDRWTSLLPSLIDSLLSYDQASVGNVFQPVLDIVYSCSVSTCPRKAAHITTLYFDRTYSLHLREHQRTLWNFTDFRTVTVTACSCYSIPQALVFSGLFPTAPSQPRVAISILLLDFYRALFERSCDAVHALSGALHSFYKRRGFHVTNSKASSPALNIIWLIIWWRIG
jgi:hypothetical protein